MLPTPQDGRTAPGSHFGVNHPLRRALKRDRAEYNHESPVRGHWSHDIDLAGYFRGEIEDRLDPVVAPAGFAFLIPWAPAWRIGLPTCRAATSVDGAGDATGPKRLTRHPANARS